MTSGRIQVTQKDSKESDAQCGIFLEFPQNPSEALAQRGCQPMDFTRRPMKGLFRAYLSAVIRLRMIWKINFISGGQSGTDRASLDFAIAKHLSHGGWCAKGRLAEDGTLDAKYQLRETPLEGTMQRSEWNVRDAEAVVIFTLGSKPMGESIDAAKFAKMQKKPVLHLHQGVSEVPEKLFAFLSKHGVRRVNIVGSKETEEQGIYEWVAKMLEKTYDLVMGTEAPPINLGGKIRSPGSR